MDSKEVVRLENVWVDFNGLVALEEISLSVRQHDFLGIIGPNGGGKTTLLRLILGLVNPSRGTVRVFGTAPEKARRHIGYVPQHSRFDFDFPASVWEVAIMGRYRHAGLFKRYGGRDKEIAEDALGKVGMSEFRNRQIGKLSKGQQQRVLLARALASQPKLLVLDEPTASVDTPMQTGFYELLGRLKQQMATVLVSHDISAVSVHVDKIACLNHRLYYHNSKEIRAEDLAQAYRCPVEMIAHGVPHRVLKKHEDDK